MSNLVNMLTNSVAEAENVSQSFLDLHVDENTGLKAFGRRWTVRQLAKELDMTTGQISDAILDIPGLVPVESDSRLKEYSLSSLKKIRDYFMLSPCRANTDDPVVLSIMSGKGGVAKSTISIYLSQYLAIKGYRVLIIDCDPQATVTTFCLGVVSDATFDQDDTLSPCLLDEDPSLESKIIETPIEGLHLIPACQQLQSAEIVFTSPREGADGEFHKMPHDAWLKLRDSIDGISHNYDVVLLDTAPMASNINISAAFASNMIITPITPSPIDFFSTVTYVNAIAGYIDEIADRCNYSPEDLERLAAHRYVVSKQKNGGAHENFVTLLKLAFDANIYESPFRESTEISNTLNHFNTILEQGRAVNSDSTRQTSLASIDLLFEEIIADIRSNWTSTLPALRAPQAPKFASTNTAVRA